MGLLRIFIQQPDGAPLAGMCLTLHQKQGQESSVASVGRETTDAEGVARFWAQPGIYGIEFEDLPNGLRSPERGTVITLGELTEGVEQIIRLEAGAVGPK